MASIVDICNLALAHLGDEATVSSIDPPEGSAQAEHCARFYPVARDAALEAHNWNFATTRVQLAAVESHWPSWACCYVLPADYIKAIAVLPPGVMDDYSTSLGGGRYPAPGAVYSPQAYSIETDETGRRLLYTDQAEAVLRYVRRVEDATRFSPLFVDALSRLLASYLAGPVIKGSEGTQAARAQLSAYSMFFGQATASDSNQRQARPRQNVPWIGG